MEKYIGTTKSAVFDYIHEQIAGKPRPLIVGINGAYTAGKTLFTGSLSDSLNVKGIPTQVIHYDDFHRPFSSISWSDSADEIEAFYNRAFDGDKLVEEVLRPLRADGRICKDLKCIDLYKGTFTNLVHLDVGANTIVLLEGVLLFRPPILEYLDNLIYLDVDSDEIIRRAKLRDVPKFGQGILDKFVTRYIPVQQRYIEEFDPMDKADVVIDNEKYDRPRIIHGGAYNAD